MEFVEEEASNYRRWKGWLPANFGAYSSFEEGYFAAELVRAGVNEFRIKVLELGFGNGNFVGFMRARGAEVVGVEADAELVAAAVGYGIEAHNFDGKVFDKLGSKRFDLIVAFDVFEHMDFDMLTATLRQLGERLSESGIILARFPSGDSPFSGAMFNGDTTHRTYLGTGKVEQLAQTAGLDLVFVKAACLPIRGDGFRRSIRRFAVVIGRLLIREVLRKLYYNDQPRVVDPNAVAVFKRPRRER